MLLLACRRRAWARRFRSRRDGWSAARPRAAQDAGGLYAANTLGAAAGAVLAGFVLIPALGLRGIDVGRRRAERHRGGRRVCIARARPRDDLTAATPAGTGAGSRQPESKRTPSRVRPSERRRPGAAVAGRGRAWRVSGFASLTLQVVWTRLLVQILGPTTYAFSIVVAIFIIGIAGGAAIGARLAARVRSSRRSASRARMLISAGLALAAASAVDWALLTIGRDRRRDPTIQFADVLRARGAAGAGLLLPMTIAFGAAFPFAVAVAGGPRRQRSPSTSACIYASTRSARFSARCSPGSCWCPVIGLHLTIRARRRDRRHRRGRDPRCAPAAARGRVAGFALAGVGRRSRSRSLPQWDPLAAVERRLQVRARRCAGPSLETALDRRRAAVVPRRRDRHRGGAPAGRHRRRWPSTARSTPRTPATC